MLAVESTLFVRTRWLAGAALLSALCCAPLQAAHADDPPASDPKRDDSATPRPLIGNYQIYGGTLAAMQPPSARDRKVTFVFKGPLAQELFEQIGPDVKDGCSAQPRYRERRAGELVCTRDEDSFSCYLGLDAATGRSIVGVRC